MKKFTSSWLINGSLLLLWLASTVAVVADKGDLPVANIQAARGNGVILGDRCNVRSRPSTTAEVVVQLNKGAEVTVVGSKAVTEAGKARDWYQILLPATARCYVAADLLEGGVVTGESVYVRCGPGRNYRDVGKLAQGDRVTVVETKAGWTQIRPSPECTGWIAAELVSYTPAVAAPAPGPVTEIIPAPIALPPAPLVDRVEVITTDPDAYAIYVVKNGLIRRVAATADAPAPYELLTAERGRIQHRVAYLEAPPEVDIARYLDRPVRVFGNQRWNRGERYPVILADRVQIVW